MKPAADSIVSGDAVLYEPAGSAGVGLLRLNRPANRNSMTAELLDGFALAHQAARNDANLRCLVVTGSGRCFCAGADFHAAVQRPPAQEGAAGRALPHERSFAMYEPFLALLDMPVPVVGALNGHAVGGGFGLALVCDIRVGAREAKYGANFAKLGLHPGMAISYLLPRVVGPQRAALMLLTGELLDGATAADWGLLAQAVATEAVPATAWAIAANIAANAPLAVRSMTRALRAHRDAAFAAARAEAYAQAESLTTDDAKEGIAALLGKRKPQFHGR